jgi:predicted RNA-binding Zn-ribbon protein involved in translation (DUF1610 family)
VFSCASSVVMRTEFSVLMCIQCGDENEIQCSHERLVLLRTKFSVLMCIQCGDENGVQCSHVHPVW